MALHFFQCKKCEEFQVINTLPGTITYPFLLFPLHFWVDDFPAFPFGGIWYFPGGYGFGPVTTALQISDYLEDHPRTCKWLITMVIVSPLRIGLWDPLQMAYLHGETKWGWSDHHLQVLGAHPPSRHPSNLSCLGSDAPDLSRFSHDEISINCRHEWGVVPCTAPPKGIYIYIHYTVLIVLYMLHICII